MGIFIPKRRRNDEIYVYYVAGRGHKTLSARYIIDGIPCDPEIVRNALYASRLMNRASFPPTQN